MTVQGSDGRGPVVGLPLLILLSLASSVSPFGLTIVVPTLNELAVSFDVAYGRVQFLLSIYLFGLAIGQPVAGILGDRFGRRPVLILGLLLFVAASVGCALVTNFDLLVALRFVQAAGVSVGTVCSRAILRDTHDPTGAAEANSYVAAAMGFAPIVAPVIGGIAGATYGGQSVFAISAALALVIALGISMRLPETQGVDLRTPIRARQYLENYAELIRSRRFVGYTLMFGFGQGIFLAFMAVGAPVFAAYLGLGQREFGITWGSMAVGYVAVAMLGGRLSRRFDTLALLMVSTALTCATGWALWGVAMAGALNAVSLIGLLGLLIAYNGFITPLSLAGAISDRPQIAGTASGLSSSAGLVIGGSFTVIAGNLYRGDFAPVALVMALACTMTLAMALLIRTTAR